MSMGGGSLLPYSRQTKKPTTPSWSSSSRVDGAEINNPLPLFCNCERRAVLRISRTPRNPGRAFYGCPFPLGEGNCGYLVWVDEIPKIFKVPERCETLNDTGSEGIMKAELIELIGKVDTLVADVRMVKFGVVVMCVLLSVCLVWWIGRQSA